MRGIEPPDLTKPYAWVEPGCGNGMTTAMIAVMDPNAEAWGLDFDPTAIAGAQTVKERIGATNARFARMSFNDMSAATAAEMPRFKFASVHGVLSAAIRATEQL